MRINPSHTIAKKPDISPNRQDQQDTDALVLLSESMDQLALSKGRQFSLVDDSAVPEPEKLNPFSRLPIAKDASAEIAEVKEEEAPIEVPLPTRMADVSDYQLPNDSDEQPNELGLIVKPLLTGNKAKTDLRDNESYLTPEQQDAHSATIEEGKLITEAEIDKKPNYVLLADGRLIVGNRNHDQLAAGLPTACAGMFLVKGDKTIAKMSNSSGSYGPSNNQLVAAAKYLHQTGNFAPQCVINYHTHK